MEVESSICLSDLVPALRWSRPQQVAEALGDPRLPAGWWSSLPLSKALGMAGLDWVCERLARLASSRWDHLPLADLLPALTVHHTDPALPGWPEATRIAVTGLGGWQRLRRLSPSDLSTPSATPEVVMGSVFREILSRIPAQREAPQADHPEVTRPLQRGTVPAASPDEARGTGPFPVQPATAPPQTGSFAAQNGLMAAAQSGPPATAPSGPSPATPSGSPSATPGGPLPVGQSGPPAGAQSGPQAAASHGEGPSGAPAEGAGQQRQTGPFGAPAQGDSGPHRQTGSFPDQPQRQTGAFPAQAADAGSQRQTGSFPAQPSPDSGSQRATGSFPAQPADGATQRLPGPFAGQPESGPQRQTGPLPAPGGDSGPHRQAGPSPAQSGPFSAQPSGDGPRQGFAGEGLPQRPAPGQAGRLPQRPADPQPGRPDTGSLPSGPALGAPLPGGSTPGGPLPGGPSTGSIPAIPALPGANGSTSSTGTPAYPSGSGPVPSDTDHAMVRVVDNLFRSLNKLELSVAVHRLFAEDPVSLRTLAHKMLVEKEALSQAQRTAEERVLQWLRSSESAPVTGHMFRLTEWLGAAATEDQLIGADPAHPVTVPSLRTPLWRVLVTLMPDRRLQDGWLVVGDLHRLQARTRQLLAASPPDADVVELMAELGIRAHSAQAWLDALPPETASDPVSSAPSPSQPLPRRTPGANGHHHRGGQPIPPVATSSIDPSAALATLSALSGGRSGMLPVAGTPATPPPPLPSPSSDPRRWQRIEVTPEHLRGGPVPVPEGYAAQLGMRPGTLLSVTGPGDNAIVLVWQGHQPVFDSLQPVLMRLNARPGDQVYVTVDGYRLEAQLTA
ncbi:hypothetical protein [Nonomuraea sp. SYSU D8015]|uniref:hypothetical protein n=1 Tax=Nonomuraea sp. SYSU D8015 TaxID=2593644 RepID=UPI001660287A|nr:hypothetical protein [Nonomuraea sp. SYSU D8015]